VGKRQFISSLDCDLIKTTTHVQWHSSWRLWTSVY